MKRTLYIFLAIVAATGCFRHRGNPDVEVVASPADPAPVETVESHSPADSTARPEDPMETISRTVRDPKVAENPSPSSLKPTVIGDVLEVDKTVHDFGDITEDQGPQACTFTIKNISDSPIAIYEVVSSCGCTEATWTREPLQPGKTGTVSATYKNEDGPIPFDKTLTVYVSAMKKPFLLRLRGSVHGKKMSLKEIYGNHLCQGLGLKETSLKGGNMEQGESRSDQIMVANLGRKPITVSFTDVSDNLKMEVEPNPIPAGSTAVMSWTVTSSRSIWGRHEYLATPVVNGTPCTGTVLKVWAVTKENFAGMTEEERMRGPVPVFTESSFSFGTVKAGTPVMATYSFTNTGKSTFKCYSADCDTPKARVGEIPEIPAGGKGSFHVELDTTGLEGEVIVFINLVTNSPSRPIVNLFLVGAIEDQS